jgi:hypothetical protein
MNVQSGVVGIVAQEFDAACDCVSEARLFAPRDAPERRWYLDFGRLSPRRR